MTACNLDSAIQTQIILIIKRQAGNPFRCQVIILHLTPPHIPLVLKIFVSMLAIYNSQSENSFSWPNARFKAFTLNYFEKDSTFFGSTPTSLCWQFNYSPPTSLPQMTSYHYLSNHPYPNLFCWMSTGVVNELYFLRISLVSGLGII